MCNYIAPAARTIRELRTISKLSESQSSFWCLGQAEWILLRAGAELFLLR
jgi:hypothetical protein